MDVYALSGGYVTTTVGPDWSEHVVMRCVSDEAATYAAKALRAAQDTKGPLEVCPAGTLAALRACVRCYGHARACPAYLDDDAEDECNCHQADARRILDRIDAEGS